MLTPQEVDILFETLNKLRSEGTSILYISHKLEEIRTLCDHATILRLGKNVGECVPAETIRAGHGRDDGRLDPADARTLGARTLVRLRWMSLGCRCRRRRNSARR